MTTASWTQIVKPKDFVHVWTCHDFTFTEPKVALQSPIFKDDRNNSWYLYLRLDNLEQVLNLVYYIREYSEYATPIIHFLDKHGKIFEPEGWKTGFPVTFCRRESYTSTISLPFDLRQQLGLLLHNGNLRIQLRFLRDPVTKSGLGTKIHHEDNCAPSTLTSDLNTIFQSSIFSDVTICTRTETFPAHKAILAGRSPVFKAMLEAPMKEAATNTIKIDEFCPEIVEGMLKYLYSDDVTVVTPALAAEYLQIADFYNLDKLKYEAGLILSKNITAENAAEVLRHAITYGPDSLKSDVIEFIIR